MRAKKTDLKKLNHFVNRPVTLPPLLVDKAEKRAEILYGKRSFSKYIRNLVEEDVAK